MFWLDRIFGDLEVALKDTIASGKTLLVRDEKTASGRVHIGSMRALVLHAAIAERLREAQVPNTFMFEINDMDPMDGFPVYLPEEFRQYMGKPLFAIPSPDGKAKNFAEYFAAEYIQAIHEAGFTPELYRATDLYLTGRMNEAIRLVLDKADVVRRIYKEVSGADRPSDWFALSVICEQCGKIGTTKVSAWDGNEVTYTCYPTAVTWAIGCGHAGRVSPFDGKAKLPWKVEWAAKWFVLGVDIEGGGKDHYSKGGARDVARHIAQEVFNYTEPFGVPNEFFLVGGKKMSSSKGEGVAAKDIVELVPNKIFRLALFGKDINQQITFDPEGDTIPVLYDQYDKLAAGYAADKTDDYARLFEYVHKDRKVPTFTGSLPRFSQVAFMVQMPHIDLYQEFAGADVAELDERAAYAKKWLNEYAPEKFVFKLQDTVPQVVLEPEQKAALADLHTFLSANPTASAEDIHAKLHESKQFKAVYLAFLAKDHGPKAGWFIASLPRDFVLARLAEASQ